MVWIFQCRSKQFGFR